MNILPIRGNPIERDTHQFKRKKKEKRKKKRHFWQFTEPIEAQEKNWQETPDFNPTPKLDRNLRHLMLLTEETSESSTKHHKERGKEKQEKDWQKEWDSQHPIGVNQPNVEANTLGEN
jgi:hypothetical protein